MSNNKDLLDSLKIDRSAPPPQAPPHRRWVIGTAVAAVVLAAGGIAWGLSGRNPEVPVRTTTVSAMGDRTNAAAVLDATGYVVARRKATVSAKITGKVREVLIEEGQHVKEGDVLATLDPIDADAQRALSASQLEAARSQVGQVQAQLIEARANATRMQHMVQQQLVSRAQYEQGIAQRDALQAQLHTAQRNVTVAQRSLRIADQGVDNTIVRAPFSGVITTKDAQPGEIVSPLSAGGGFTRTGIGTVVDMDSLEVQVDVGEAYIGRVQAKMPTVTILNAYPDWKIHGHVIATIPTADRGKATVQVRVAIDSRDPKIVPDMGARVSFLEHATTAQAQQAAPGVRVAQAAITERDGQPVAFVVAEDNTVELRALKIGTALNEDRQILTGLAAGDNVVLDPPATLRDGSKVTIDTGDGDPGADTDA